MKNNSKDGKNRSDYDYDYSAWKVSQVLKIDIPKSVNNGSNEVKFCGTSGGEFISNLRNKDVRDTVTKKLEKEMERKHGINFLKLDDPRGDIGVTYMYGRASWKDYKMIETTKHR